MDHDIDTVRVRTLEHIVAQGQTWERMATRYGVTMRCRPGNPASTRYATRSTRRGRRCPCSPVATTRIASPARCTVAALPGEPARRPGALAGRPERHRRDRAGRPPGRGPRATRRRRGLTPRGSDGAPRRPVPSTDRPAERLFSGTSARAQGLTSARHDTRCRRQSRSAAPVLGARDPGASSRSPARLARSRSMSAGPTPTVVVGSTTTTEREIRPFTIDVPDAQLADLRDRVAATKWPDREVDSSQGVQLETIQALAEYWANGYDWRAFEQRFAALPQFVTEIDGVDIHFIHVRSEHEDALPLIVTHGWPGSTVEQLKIIGPLTDPTAHGADAADAFHLVIPSLPGHGFSGKPTETGWDPIRIARAWAELMERLGYTRYVAQGGDWGNAVTEQMALLKPAGLMGIHTNMPATVPPEVSQAISRRRPGAGGPHRRRRRRRSTCWSTSSRPGPATRPRWRNRPQTLYGIADSPVGLAAWMLDHDVASYELIARAFDGHPGGLSRDDVLDNITHYWLTNTAISSARLYWESKLPFFDVKGVDIPVGVTVFRRRALPGPAELGRAGLPAAHPLQRDRPRAATSPPGSSRRSSRRRCGRRSGRCGDQVGGAPRRGRLPAARRGHDVAELGAADAGGPAREGRRGPVLHLLLHQLAAHRALRQGVGRGVPRRRVGGDRRPLPRVRVRARPGEGPVGPRGDGHRLPGGRRRRLRDLARLRQRVLARPLRRRRAGPDPVPPLRRGGLRELGAGDPAAARRGGGRRRRRPRVGRAGRGVPRRRLAPSWGRRRPTSATPGPPDSPRRAASPSTAAGSTPSRRSSG